MEQSSQVNLSRFVIHPWPQHVLRLQMDTLMSRVHVKKQKRIPSTPSNAEDPDNEKMNGVC